MKWSRQSQERKLRTTGAKTVLRAIEDYAVEHGVYPAAGSMKELKARLVLKDGTPMPIRDVYGQPTELPMRDPWFRPWVVEVTDQNYSIRSFGVDGKPDLDPPRGGMLDTESGDRDTIIVDGIALQHLWKWGGGGDEGCMGSLVSLERGPHTGKVIFDYPVDVLRDGRVLASLSKGPGSFQGPAGQYQFRVHLSGSDYTENVVVERGRVRQKEIRIPSASINAKKWSSFQPMRDPHADLLQGDRLLASDCFDCGFYVVPGRYRLRLRDGMRILFDETNDLKDGDKWDPDVPKGPENHESVSVQVAQRSRYAYPTFAIDGDGVHQERQVAWDGFPLFGVPAGKYEVSVLLSGQVARTGAFESQPHARVTRDVALTWGDVHVSLEGPVEIHEGSAAGWEAAVRDDKNVLARSERFPAVFFLLPGNYTVELLKDGHVRRSKRVAVAAKSEQWIALGE